MKLTSPRLRTGCGLLSWTDLKSNVRADACDGSRGEESEPMVTPCGSDRHRRSGSGRSSSGNCGCGALGRGHGRPERLARGARGPGRRRRIVGRCCRLHCLLLSLLASYLAFPLWHFSGLTLRSLLNALLLFFLPPSRIHDRLLPRRTPSRRRQSSSSTLPPPGLLAKARISPTRTWDNAKLDRMAIEDAR